MKVLVVEVPALRPSYLGCYGNEWVTTPAFDRLAAEGVVFDSHLADSLGAGRTAWTGRYHLPGPDAEPASPSAGPDLTTLLHAAAIPASLVGPPMSDRLEGTVLEQTLDAVVDALDRLAPHPRWLLWAVLPSLAPPWHVPAAFQHKYFSPELLGEGEESLGPLPCPPVGLVERDDHALWERVQLTYAAAVSYLDAGLGLLTEEFARRDLLDELLLVLTAEQGLALGEHGILGPARVWLHDELIHLPLLVRLPCAAEAGRRVFALTQPVDLLPTLLEAFGLPPPEGTHGRSLLPAACGEEAGLRAYACAGGRAGGGMEWALRTAAWACILPVTSPEGDAPREPQLYVKPDDRWEVNNVRQHHLELAEHLEEVLRGFVTAARRPGPLQPPPLRDVEAESRQAPARHEALMNPEGG
jgi:arylsulfatase A-like enzyme